jgi:3-dehydroquinate synthetase
VTSVFALRADRSFVSRIERETEYPAIQDAALRRAIDGRPAVLFLSTTVDKLYGAGLRAAFTGQDQHVIVVQTGETNKRLDTVARLLDHVAKLHFSRRGVFVAVGGGVLLDIVGLAANLFRRGVPVVKVGTTLLAQVDASVGAKCAVNHPMSKNLVGTFYPSELTILDSKFLESLPAEEIRAGLAEMLKLSLVCDAELFELLEAHGESFYEPSFRRSRLAESIVDRAVIGMAAELQRNLYEEDLLRAVDFGHSLSPALEATLNYSISHGDAVAIDMYYMCHLSREIGWLSSEDLVRIKNVYGTLRLPGTHAQIRESTFVRDSLLAVSVHRGMSLNLPLPLSIGTHRFIEELGQLDQLIKQT